MTATKEEILKIFEEEGVEVNDAFSGYDVKKFKVVSQDESYDEGNLYSTTVVEHRASGRFFEGTNCTNSWCDHYEDYEENDIVEVFPTEKTITVYVTKDKLPA